MMTLYLGSLCNVLVFSVIEITIKMCNEKSSSIQKSIQNYNLYKQ